MGYVLLNIKSAKILQNHNEHIILFCIKNEDGIKTTILPRVQVLIVRKKLSQNIFSKIRPKKQKSPCKTRTFSLSCQIDLQRWLPRGRDIRKDTRSFKLGKGDSFCFLVVIECDDHLVIVEKDSVDKCIDKPTSVFQFANVKGSEML